MFREARRKLSARPPPLRPHAARPGSSRLSNYVRHVREKEFPFINRSLRQNSETHFKNKIKWVTSWHHAKYLPFNSTLLLRLNVSDLHCNSYAKFKFNDSFRFYEPRNFTVLICCYLLQPFYFSTRIRPAEMALMFIVISRWHRLHASLPTNPITLFTQSSR